MSLIEQIDALAAAHKLSGLSFWRTQEGWQVCLQEQAGGRFRCMRSETPSVALAALLKQPVTSVGVFD